MKRVILSTIVIALCSIIAIPTNVWGKTSNDKAEKCLWQSKLDNVKTKNFKNGLKLVDYEHICSITDKQQIKDFKNKCLDDNAYMSYYPDQKTNMTITTIGDLKKKNQTIYRYFTAHLTSSTDRIKLGDAEIVKLKWEYNGKKFETYAVVTNTVLKGTRDSGIDFGFSYLIFENMLMPLYANTSVVNSNETSVSYTTLS